VRILLSVPGFTEDSLFSTSARDNTQQPFIVLRDALAERGHELLTPDAWQGDAVDALLAWDMPPQALYQELVWRHGIRRKVLITGEPPVVRPDNWIPDLHELFNVVLTWNDALVDNTFYRKFHWPQPLTVGDVTDVPFANRKLITHISGNKMSSGMGELYSLRRDFVRYFERCVPTEFDLYGAGWDAREWPSYRGAPAHKVDVYPNYRFALVTENMFASGWITEKLFDAVRCGVVPIYYGASNIEQYVPPAAYIDLRQFTNRDALVAHLAGMSEVQWASMRAVGQSFVGSEAFAKWLPAAFVQTVCEALGIE
jgi:hypothetical protein